MTHVLRKSPHLIAVQKMYVGQILSELLASANVISFVCIVSV